MRLKYQVLLTLLTASAVLIALMYAISSWSFSRGFLEYVNQNEVARLSPVVERVIDRYEEEGNWQWVSGENFSFRTDNPRRQQRPEKADRLSKRDADVAGNERLRPANPGRDGPGRTRQRRPYPPLTLTDANKVVLAGKPIRGNRMQWIPLESNADVVGYLAFPKLGRVDWKFDQAFENRQRKTFGFTALAMILISALLSIPLASRIVRPLLTVNKAVGEISGGNYSHRVNVNRRDEIGDLANNINSLGVSLEKNRDARQRWIAEISHELRTPLAVLRGEIEAVQDGVRVLDKQAIESLHGEVLSLGRLIDDLHTLSVSDVGALDYQKNRLDLAELLTLSIEPHRSALAEKSVVIEKAIAHDNALVLGDAQRLEQLFANLMQNTLRYTDPGGKLLIRLRRDELDNKPVLIVDWLDSSPGVDGDAMEKLFDPLFRTESSRNREFGGTGLGLSIAKRIVEAHQGSITADASALGGLHIKIVLPAVEKRT